MNQHKKKEFYYEILQRDKISLIKIMFEEFHLVNIVKSFFYLIDYFQYIFFKF